MKVDDMQRKKDGWDTEGEEKRYWNDSSQNVRKWQKKGWILKKETGRMREGFGWGFLLLICFISSGCSLPVSLPSSLLPSVRQTAFGQLSLLLFTPSRVSLIQPDPSVPLSPSKYALIFHFSPLPPDPRHQPGRIRSSLQFTDRRLKRGHMRTSVTSAFSQSLFGLLNLLLVMCLCLTWHRAKLCDTSEEPEWVRAVYSNYWDDLFKLGHCQ